MKNTASAAVQGAVLFLVASVHAKTCKLKGDSTQIKIPSNLLDQRTGGTRTCNGDRNGVIKRTPARAFDGSLGYEIWEGHCANELGFEHSRSSENYLTVDLGKVMALTQLTFVPEPDWYHYERMPDSVTIFVGTSLTDDEGWEEAAGPIKTLQNPARDLNRNAKPTITFDSPVCGRYFKFYFPETFCPGKNKPAYCTHQQDIAALAELQMYGGDAIFDTTTQTATTTTTSVTTTKTSTSRTTTSATTTTPARCTAGEYRDRRSNVCKRCPADTFQSAEDHSLDRCSAVSTCKDDEYVASAATSIANVRCTKSKACGDDEWETKAHAPGEVERECSLITECVGGQYILVAATASSDNVCAACDGTDMSFQGGCTTTTATYSSTTTTTTTTSTATYSSTTTTTTTTTSTTTATATTTTTTHSTTTTTTTTLNVAKLRADGGTAAELLKMGADPVKLVESNYTAVELAEAGLSAEDIAAAADAAASGNTLGVSDLKLVEDMTAEILKENGFSANALMLGGFSSSDLEDAGFSSSAIRIAQSKYDRANPASSATSAGTNQTVIIIAAVLILFVVLGAAMYVHRAKGAQQNGGDGSVVAFENPMYADGFNGGQQPQGSAGYMDVPAGGGLQTQSGYMDVAPPTSTAGASAAYVDVAPTEQFDGGLGGDGFESDDEEV